MLHLNLSLAIIQIWVLSIWTIGHAQGCGVGQTKINGHCCNMCPPGTHVQKFCTEHQQTVCIPCKDGFYTNQNHTFDRCEECLSCQHEYAEKCSLTTNAVCSCRSGFLCSNNLCSVCEENKCVIGERLRITENSNGRGEVQYSYQCEPICLEYAYFDVKKNACRPWTQCSALGLAEQFPGNKTHDSVCDRPETHREDSIIVILGVGFVLLSLTILLFLSRVCIKNLRKRTAKNNRVLAVSTNTREFHLSKEESGFQHIIQDESKDNNSFDELHMEKFL